MTAQEDDAHMVVKWMAAAAIVLFLVMWLIRGKRLGLLQAGGRRWLTCLHLAVWGSVFMMFVYSYVFGFVPGIAGGVQVVVGLGAAGGALAGLLVTHPPRRLPR